MLQSSSSWADEADEPHELEVLPPAPAANPWKKAEEIKPVGLVFEDFEGPKGGENSGGERGGNGDRGDRGGYGDRGGFDRDRGDDRYGDRGGYDDRGGYGERGGYGGDRGGRGDRGGGNDRYGDRGDRYGDRGGYGGGGDRYENRGSYGDRGGGGDRYGGNRGDRYGDRGDRYGDRGGGRGGRGDRYDRDDAGPSDWRNGNRDTRDRFVREDPTEEVLARIPADPPFTGFVQVAPSVSTMEITEPDVCEHYHNEEEGIIVKSARVLYHKEMRKVKMIFVDFEDAESLRKALYVDKEFMGYPIKITVAESREPKRPERNPLGGSAQQRRERERAEKAGIRPTAFDVDAQEAEWMAKRVQEAVALGEGEEAAETTPKVKKDDGPKSNPFGNAKPRDQNAIEAAFEARRAEERKREQEERRRKKEEEAMAKEGAGKEGAGKGGPGAGKRGGKAGVEGGGGSSDWRSDAKPPEPRVRAPRPPRERDERKERKPREDREHPEKKTEEAPAPAKEAAPAAAPAPKPKYVEPKKPEPKKPAKPVNMFDLLGDGSDE